MRGGVVQFHVGNISEEFWIVNRISSIIEISDCERSQGGGLLDKKIYIHKSRYMEIKPTISRLRRWRSSMHLGESCPGTALSTVLVGLMAFLVLSPLNG
jgi:hypothetical protein